MEAVLALSAELAGAAPQRERADAWLLERISQLIGLEVADYCLHDETSRTLLSETDYPANPVAEPWAPTDHQWEILKAQMPFARYVARTGDRYFSARRCTDVVDMRTFSQTEYFEVFDVALMPHEIQMRLPGEPDTHWTLGVARSGQVHRSRQAPPRRPAPVPDGI